MSDEKVGFVLAGGGFKGAFELGALQHLIGTRGLVPRVITATSAGAVLGTVVGQGRDADECRRRLLEAEGDLMAMTRTDVVFSEQPWLAQLDGTTAAESIHRLVTQHGRPRIDDDWDELEAEALVVLSGETAPVDGRRPHHFEQVASLTRTLVGGRRQEHGLPRAVLNLGPFEEAVRGRRDDVGISTIDSELVARPGLELRLAVTALRQRQTHYVTERGDLVGPDARTPLPGSDATDVIDGVIASASVPGVFPPRSLGGDHYVDGGCLQNIPLRAAVELGATQIYSLVAVPVKPPRRSLSLWAAESLGYLSTQAENLAVPLPDGVTNTVIQPTIEVVGSFEVHPGLMRIDIHYGRMRAEECTAGMDPGLDPIVRMASDTVTTMRQLAWQLEQHCIDEQRIDRVHRERLRALKHSVRTAVDARAALGFPAPVGSEQWSRGWELHATPVRAGFPTELD
ncbi:MAG: patatin-like phospholipase family protein [Actinomycetota bacterium]|nr:patatin-like phospholipase family protein [Actinomycetota bacterium]